MIGLAASLYPLLSLYALAYVAVPAVRYVLLGRSNAQIEVRSTCPRGCNLMPQRLRPHASEAASSRAGGCKPVCYQERNSARRVWRDALRAGGGGLKKKLGSARQRAGKVHAAQ